MHGYQHVMHSTKAKLILPFYERSEFGGLPYEAQVVKIRESWALFVAEQVKPSVWIAPAHCFDRLTLKAIRNETPIRIVSDGIARDQYFEDGFFGCRSSFGVFPKNHPAFGPFVCIQTP